MLWLLQRCQQSQHVFLHPRHLDRLVLPNSNSSPVQCFIMNINSQKNKQRKTWTFWGISLNPPGHKRGTCEQESMFDYTLIYSLWSQYACRIYDHMTQNVYHCLDTGVGHLTRSPLTNRGWTQSQKFTLKTLIFSERKVALLQTSHSLQVKNLLNKWLFICDHSSATCKSGHREIFSLFFSQNSSHPLQLV